MIIMTMMMTMTLRRSRPARRRLAESASPRCVLAAGSASTTSESSTRPSDTRCYVHAPPVQVLPLRRGEEVARELPQVRGVRGGAGERGIVLREGGADILQRRLPEVSCVNFHNVPSPC